MVGRERGATNLADALRDCKLNALADKIPITVTTFENPSNVKTPLPTLYLHGCSLFCHIMCILALQDCIEILKTDVILDFLHSQPEWRNEVYNLVIN